MRTKLFIAISCLSLFSSHFAQGNDDLPNGFTKSADSTEAVQKWKVEQGSDEETVAVMRFEHRVAGTLVVKFEEITYWPETTDVGELILETDHGRLKVTFPSGNPARFRLDGKWHVDREWLGDIECVDGKKRGAQSMLIAGTHENIQVSFYLAPMEIFRKKLPKMPNPKVDKTTKFMWRLTYVEGTTYAVGTTKIDDKETIDVYRVKDPQASSGEKKSTVRGKGRAGK